MSGRTATSHNSFGASAQLDLGDGRSHEIYRLDALASSHDIGRLPFSLKILLENLLRHEDGVTVRAEDVDSLAGWDPDAEPDREIAFAPARILMQDFTGVPAVVDLAAMRDAMVAMRGDASRVNPLIPAELVIDHSIVADVYGVPDAFVKNAELEFGRNRERYQFLRWGQNAFGNFRVVPPNTGICHQVNLEYLARVVFVDDATGQAYPDTLLGTDSHTTMVNGLGVLGWGVGGIEAEAAMLGQPVSMLVPRVVGFKLTGALPEGTTATDMVLTVTELLRKHGVVGKFVEFYGDGVATVPLANRATIGNMSPEYGSTCAIFPIDDETLSYLEFTGRSAEQISLVEAYAKTQGLWHDPDFEPAYSERLELDLSQVRPSLAGPTRPQDRVPLDRAKAMFRASLASVLPPEAKQAAGAAAGGGGDPTAGGDPSADGDRYREVVPVKLADGTSFELDHGHVVIAAITSCTNTSNPSVMIAAGLLARNAVDRGLMTKPWVKTSLAPGSKVVIDYYERSGLMPYLEKLRFRAVGQSQLRGSHQPGRADELPGIAPSGCRVRAGRQPGRGPSDRAAGRGPRRPAGLPEGHLAGERRDQSGDRRGHSVGHVPHQLRRGVPGRRAMERAAGADRQELRLGRHLDLRPQPAVLRGHARAADPAR